MNWYLLHVYTGQEDKAEANLITQGFTIYNPKISVERIRKGGAVETKDEAAFRSYLFIQFDPLITNTMPIRSTPGVISLVKFGENLARVPTKIIENIKTSLPKHIKYIPQKDDIIQIRSGPFKELQGVYIEPDGGKRSIVLLTLINRVQRVSIDNNQIL